MPLRCWTAPRYKATRASELPNLDSYKRLFDWMAAGCGINCDTQQVEHSIWRLRYVGHVGEQRDIVAVLQI